jgi:hypothetical protein
MPGTSLEPFIDNGYLKQADTLAELARTCGIGPDGLTAEVVGSTLFAEQGIDQDFGRGGSVHNRLMGDPTVRPVHRLERLKSDPITPLKSGRWTWALRVAWSPTNARACCELMAASLPDCTRWEA